MAHSQFVANYDEAKVPAYVLPDILQSVSGKKIKTSKDWERNRADLLNLFEENMFGKTPILNLKQHFEIQKINNNALNGTAIQKQVSIVFDDYPALSPINILLYLPKNVKKPAVFFGLNFEGNHSLTTDSEVFITKNWVNDFQRNPLIINQNRATEASRGTAIVETWPFEKIVEAGFAVATVFHGDIEADKPDGWKESIRNLDGISREKSWSTMGAWAWGLSRIVDYLESDVDINAKKLIVIGHSRMGKAAIWAAAQDQRIAALISNESGEGGAALTKREFGETTERINNHFPHWFTENYKKFNKNSVALPFDQHQLLGLIAPRPIYVSSAEGDQWSDPTGEFLSLKFANPIYNLYKKPLLVETTRPPVNQPIGSYNRYHYRTGKHDMNDYDWEQYLRFAKEVIR
jgi:hypothetical protein